MDRETKREEESLHWETGNKKDKGRWFSVHVPVQRVGALSAHPWPSAVLSFKLTFGPSSGILSLLALEQRNDPTTPIKLH